MNRSALMKAFIGAIVLAAAVAVVGPLVIKPADRVVTILVGFAALAAVLFSVHTGKHFVRDALLCRRAVRVRRLGAIRGRSATGVLHAVLVLSWDAVFVLASLAVALVALWYLASATKSGTAW